VAGEAKMPSWNTLLETARANGYTGSDRPASDDDDLALSEALRRATKGHDEPGAWKKVATDARDFIYLWQAERIVTQSKGRNRWWKSRPAVPKSILSHPLTLLLLGAIFSAFLTGYLVPRIGRGWNDRSAELQFKSDLTRQVSESVTDAMSTGRVLTGYLLPEQRQAKRAKEIAAAADEKHKEAAKAKADAAADGALAAGQRRLVSSREEWLRNSAMIKTKLRAYFPKTDLSIRWERFDKLVLGYLVLSSQGDPAARESSIKTMQENLPETQPETWDVLRQRIDDDNRDRFFKRYETLRDPLLTIMDQLSEDIIKEHAETYFTSRA
jgi:hypothetical protein